MVQAYTHGLSENGLEELWDEPTEKAVGSMYQGLLACVDDELYLQEFLPFGSMYRVAGEHGVRRRHHKVPIEKVMEEHILLRDVFWEYRRGRSEKVHDFSTEKRVLQCFNYLLQATVQAYQTMEPTADAMDPLRDPVTGVFNSLYFMTRLEEEVKRSERYLRDVTVVLFHVDSQFAQDSTEEAELLRAVARVLRRNSRASDILARVDYGKFAVLVPETRSEDAFTAARRLKEQVSEYLSGMGGVYTEVGIEIGMASYPESGDEGETIFQEAVESLMREELGEA
jgi:diguanylate cyclase (GGDEF)-like protein